jgi:hypothetical protein
VVRPAGRWSCHPEPPRRTAVSAASAHSWRCVLATAARSSPEESSVQAGPAHPPPWRPPSTHMKGELRISYPCRGNGRRARRFRDQMAAFAMRFTISGNGSTKNAPSAASAAVRPA